MKNKLAIIAILVTLGCVTTKANDRVGNGGDSCEERIQVIRNDIASWISKDGAAGLVLPQGLSLNQFNQGMLAQITNAKVSCTDKKIFVGKAEKTCKNATYADGVPFIQCNNQRFKNTDESEQYMLIHHEYAGLAGFETNRDETSNYVISSQVTGFLESQVVKKLVVRSPNTYSVSGRAKVFVGPQGEVITIVPLNNNTKLLVAANNTYGINNGKVLVYDFHGDIGNPEAVYRRPTHYAGALTVAFQSRQKEVIYFDLMATTPEMKTFAIYLQYSDDLSKSVDVPSLLGRAQDFNFL